MSKTTFYLSEEDRREFNRLVALEYELNNIQNPSSSAHQWEYLAYGMLTLATKYNPRQVFISLRNSPPKNEKTQHQANQCCYYILKDLVLPFVRTRNCAFDDTFFDGI